VVTSFFWWPAIHGFMLDHAIQEHPLMAIHSAVVSDVFVGHENQNLIQFISNTGERVETTLGRRQMPCCDAKLGDVVRIKYVSYDPSQAYPADYQPNYHATMVYGSIFAVIATIAAWSLRKEWSGRNKAWAAKNAKVKTTP
jgi:hypothetical protein